jgi:hypothetical protein
MTSHYIQGFMTTPHDLRGVLGWPLDSHNFMVTALVSCVKWPLVHALRLTFLISFMEGLHPPEPLANVD